MTGGNELFQQSDEFDLIPVRLLKIRVQKIKQPFADGEADLRPAQDIVQRFLLYVRVFLIDIIDVLIKLMPVDLKPGEETGECQFVV